MRRQRHGTDWRAEGRVAAGRLGARPPTGEDMDVKRGQVDSKRRPRALLLGLECAVNGAGMRRGMDVAMLGGRETNRPFRET